MDIKLFNVLFCCSWGFAIVPSKNHAQGVKNLKNIDVSVVMGSISDYDTMKETIILLEKFDISYEKKVVSAHRTPELMMNYAKEAHIRKVKVIIAAAGGAAHLPGMVAACTPLPVVGVPIESKVLHGVDSLLSIVQMPAGVPVATMAIGVAGAKNAAIFVAHLLGSFDIYMQNKVLQYKEDMKNHVIGDMQI